MKLIPVVWIICALLLAGLPALTQERPVTLEEYIDTLPDEASSDRNLRSELTALQDKLRAYQSEKDETLGLRFDRDSRGNLVLLPDARLGTNEVAISKNLIANNLPRRDEKLIRLINEYPDTIKRLDGRGIIEASVRDGRWPGDDQQTIDPLQTGIGDITGIRNKYCLNKNCGCKSVDECIVERPFGTRDNVRFDIGALDDFVSRVNSKPTDAVACSLAQGKFATYIEPFKQYWTLQSEPEINSEIESIIDAFDDSCLEGVEEVPAGILDRIAVLRLPDSPAPFCTALRVGPDTFLTAAHCFYDPRHGRLINVLLEHSRLYMYRMPAVAIEFASPKADLAIWDGGSRGKLGIPAYRDVIVLRTHQSDPSVTPLDLAEPVVARQALLVGYFPLATSAKKPLSATSWTRAIRRPKPLSAEQCRILDASSNRDGGCFVHRCQATEGFSGSPLFQQSDTGEFQLVGVHVRANTGTANHCPPGLSISGEDKSVDQAVNLAAWPLPGILDQ